MWAQAGVQSQSEGWSVLSGAELPVLLEAAEPVPLEAAEEAALEHQSWHRGRSSMHRNTVMGIPEPIAIRSYSNIQPWFRRGLLKLSAGMYSCSMDGCDGAQDGVLRFRPS